ncbi:hypothetical protein F5877DRAFT_85843 [Lentinula edodes]|nr:hypothetical protein F5877DRAFT_85843 [Lentinula edodes]
MTLSIGQHSTEFVYSGAGSSKSLSQRRSTTPRPSSPTGGGGVAGGLSVYSKPRASSKPHNRPKPRANARAMPRPSARQTRHPKAICKKDLQCRLELYVDGLVSNPDSFVSSEKNLEKIRNQWPTIVPTSVKEECIQKFIDLTSTEKLKTFTCASCSTEDFVSHAHEIESSSVDLTLLNAPNVRISSKTSSTVIDANWLEERCVAPDFHGVVADYPDAMLDINGVKRSNDGKYVLSLCQPCHSALKNRKTPALSLANHLFLGAVPEELKDLSVVEEAMISRCRAKSWIIQLKEDNGFITPTNQRGYKECNNIPAECILCVQSPTAFNRRTF